MSPVPRQQLRSLVESGRTTPVPGATDALSARLIERHGFEAVYIGSYATAASRYALPDTGLLTLDDLVAQARSIAAAVSIPVIASGGAGDLDHFVDVFTTGATLASAAEALAAAGAASVDGVTFARALEPVA